jgi:hypothetical protein
MGEGPLEPPVVVHVGFTKAASTTLQAFFGAAPDLHVVEGDRAAVLLSAKNSFLYSEPAVRAFLEPELEAARRGGRTLLVSHERLSGNPHSGHYDCKEIADRLRALVPRAKIVVCIREQMSILASAYKQYVRIGGVQTLEDYLLPPWDCRVPLFDWHVYEYRQLVGYYRELFGAERVLVMLVEELERDPATFFGAVARFMEIGRPPDRDLGIVHNPGIPDEDVERCRRRNLFRTDRASIRDRTPLQGDRLLSLFDRLGRWLPMKGYGPGRTVRDAVVSLFRGKFAESNRCLGAMIGKDLGAFGYEVE